MSQLGVLKNIGNCLLNKTDEMPLGMGQGVCVVQPPANCGSAYGAHLEAVQILGELCQEPGHTAGASADRCDVPSGIFLLQKVSVKLKLSQTS